MTITARNRVFKLVTVFVFLCLLIYIAASIKTVPSYSFMEAEITLRSSGIFQAITENFFDTKLLAVYSSILVLVLFSLSSVISIYYFFEKTHSPEILFVFLFTASFSIEVLRLIIPLGQILDIPSMYLLAASRVILFGRYLGIFSLLIASIYAAGYEIQKQRSTITIVIVTTLLIATRIPIDSHTWNSSLNMISGYTSIFRLVEIVIFFITTTGFFISAWSRGSRRFIFIGAGSALAFIGRNILLNADTWAGPLLGFLFLAGGTWLICKNLHRIYLWL